MIDLHFVLSESCDDLDHHGAILMYADQQSFEWVQNVDSSAPVKFLVANKCDIEPPEVSLSEA